MPTPSVFAYVRLGLSVRKSFDIDYFFGQVVEIKAAFMATEELDTWSKLPIWSNFIDGSELFWPVHALNTAWVCCAR